MIARSSLLFLVAAAVLGCPAAQKIADKGAVNSAPAVAGKFASEGCLSSPNADGTTSYTTIAFDVSPSSWASDTVFYGDEKCTAKQGTVHGDGPWTISNPSLKAPGSFDVDFTLTRRTMTPHVDGYIASMQSAGCGKAPYAVNEPQDILVAGCKDLGFVACARELNIVKIDPDALTFGKSVACAERPAELGTVVLKRVK